METLYETTVGKVNVKVTASLDEYGYEMVRDDLGQFTDERNADTDQPLYYRREDIVKLPGSDIWRDRRGRIAAAPDEDRYISRECQFIQIDDWHAGCSLKDAFSVADRIEGYERGDWYYLDIHAEASIAGRVIGTASLCGVESDSEKSYIAECARDMAHEAINEVREWRQSVAA